MELRLMLEGREVILHYLWRGSGKKVLITFHGFGQSGEAMFPLGEALEQEYRTCHVDIFYHGRSYWHEDIGALTKDHWKLVMAAFIEQEEIRRFDLAAFSMGGKFLLASLEILPSRIDRLLLLAPDGIETNTWYSLASYPVLFRSYFRSMIVKPWRFFSLLRTLKSIGFLDKSIAKFASTQMDTRRKRRRVYYTWVMFRRLKFNHRKIAGLINQHDIRCEFYLGKYDKIITADGMKKLTRYLKNCDIIQLETGHNQLINTTAQAIYGKK